MLDAWGDHPAVKATLEEASQALGEDVAALIHQGPKESLDLTTNTQPVMLTAAIAAFVYLRIVLTMFLPVEEGEETPPTPLRADPGTAIVIVVSCVLTLFVGVAPALLLHVAERATLLFRG